MNTTATVIVVGAVGVAVVLYLRSQQQQTAAVGAAQQQQQAAAAAAGGGGGITGFAQGLWTQWKGDPLGIQNTKAAAGAVVGVVKTGISQIASLPSDIIGGIRSIF